MEVEEVDNHAFHSIPERVVAEAMLHLRKSVFDSHEILSASLLLLFCQFHDGILEQRQMAPHTVVRLRCTEFYELFYNYKVTDKELDEFLFKR